MRNAPWLAACAVLACVLSGCTGSDADRAARHQDTTEQKRGDASEVDRVYVQLTTTEGELYLELDKERAPISTANFVAYAEAGDYDGTIFHRVIQDFMIQGGGFDPDMNQRQARDPIENEWQNGLSNERGTIAMARLGGRADSATSQFFINVSDNSFLDQPRDGAGYAVFGRVVRGMETVDRIRAVRTTTRAGHQDVPAEPVVIERAVVLSAEDAERLGL